MRTEAEIAIAVDIGQKRRRSDSRLIEAAQVLFHGLQLELGNSLDAIVANFATENMTYLSACLARILIAFSCIENLDSCHALPLCILQPVLEPPK